jgi:hypothetical protein
VDVLLQERRFEESEGTRSKAEAKAWEGFEERRMQRGKSGKSPKWEKIGCGKNWKRGGPTESIAERSRASS